MCIQTHLFSTIQYDIYVSRIVDVIVCSMFTQTLTVHTIGQNIHTFPLWTLFWFICSKKATDSVHQPNLTYLFVYIADNIFSYSLSDNALQSTKMRTNTYYFDLVGGFQHIKRILAQNTERWAWFNTYIESPMWSTIERRQFMSKIHNKFILYRATAVRSVHSC